MLYLISIFGLCRITSATLSFTQLQESIDDLVTWLDDTEGRANNETDLENTERLELLQVCFVSWFVYLITWYYCKHGCSGQSMISTRLIMSVTFKFQISDVPRTLPLSCCLPADNKTLETRLV